MDDQELVVYMTLVSPDATLPKYAHDNDAGMDIYASEDIIIHPGETKLIHTGLTMAIPDGFEAQIRPRSGLSLNTMLRIPNSPGTIDAGYRDELCVIIHNASFLVAAQEENQTVYTLQDKKNYHGSYKICRGDRIAQMVFSRVSKAEIIPVASLEGIGINRNGGFGSTGH
jgi:dUTP pyrophosphatase